MKKDTSPPTLIGGSTAPAIRERMLASLVQVSPDVAAQVADCLGMRVPTSLPRAVDEPRKSPVTAPALPSPKTFPGDRRIRTHRVALLVAHGVAGASLRAAQLALRAAGALCVVVAPRPGAIETTDGEEVEATASFENSSPLLFDAVLLPDGEAGVKSLLRHAQAVDFVADQFRHGKTLLALGASRALLDDAGVHAFLATGDADPGVLLAEAGDVEVAHTAFIAAIGKHHHPARESAATQV